MTARPLASLLAYVLAFVLVTWPLVTRPADAVLSHWDADIEHSLWTQWWFATAVESDDYALFRTDMVRFPHVVDLHLADLNLAVNALLYGLVLWLGLALGYNAALLLAFVLAGGLMQRLTRRLGASGPAAWLAGLLFAASPYWVACALNGWCYLVHVWVFPLVFLALLRARDEHDLLHCGLLGLAVGLVFHVTPYYFVYTVALLAALLPWYVHAGRDWLRRPGSAQGLVAFALAASLAIAPRAIGMIGAASTDLVVHHGPQNTALGAPLAELFWPSGDAVAHRLSRVGYLVPFLGFTLLGTLGAAVALSGRMRELLPWLVSALAMLALALGPVLKLSDGLQTGLPLPARWLQQLPVFELTSNHWRWALPAGFALTVAFALGLSGLMQRFRARELAFGVGTAFALEMLLVWPFPWRKPLWDVHPSPVAELLRDREITGAVLDRTPRRKLNQTVHGKPIVLGWLPRIDVETERADVEMLSACRDRPPQCLLRHGIGAVVRDDDTALLLREDGVELLRVR